MSCGAGFKPAPTLFASSLQSVRGFPTSGGPLPLIPPEVSGESGWYSRLSPTPTLAGQNHALAAYSHPAPNPP